MESTRVERSGPGGPGPGLGLGSLLLVLLTLAAYVPALGAGTLWDEDFVTDSALLDSVDGLVAIWAEPERIPHEEHYWPLAYTTFWLEAALFGRSPAVFHLTNVLLHALACCLAWRVLRRLTFAPAFLTAALFAVHPVHVESVAWIIERKDVLSGSLYFAAALLWLRADASGSARAYLGAIAAFVAALLTKSSIVTLPCAVALGLYWAHGRVERRQWRSLAPFFLLAVVGALGDALYAAASSQAQGAYSLLDRLVVAGHSLWFYAGKAFLPLGLVPIYPRWSGSAAAASAFLPLVAAVALPLALLAARGRVGRGPLVAALFFGGTLAPALGIVEFSYYTHFAFVADRFQYLALLAPLALVAWWLARVARSLGPALPVALVAALAVLTWRQASHYEDLAVFADFAIDGNPEAWGGHAMRGYELNQRGDPIGAERAYRAAVARRPDDAQLHTQLAVALADQGRSDEALESFRRAARLAPYLWRARYGLGHFLYAAGDGPGALAHLNAAVDLAPFEPAPHALLGRLLAATGQLERAIEVLERALELDPSDADARRDLGMARDLAAGRVPPGPPAD